MAKNIHQRLGLKSKHGRRQRPDHRVVSFDRDRSDSILGKHLRAQGTGVLLLQVHLATLRAKQVAAAGEEALPTDVLPAQVAPHGGQACVERVRTPTKKWMHRTVKPRRVPKAGHEQPKSLSKRWEASQRLTDCLHTTVATSCRRCHPQYEELQQLASAVAGQWTAHEPHTLSLGMRRGTC